MAQMQDEQGGGAPLMAEGRSEAEVKLILYHWTHSFSSQKVRLVIAEKALKCEEHDVSLPLSEHNEPWFMRLNSTGEVPVLIHGESIICEATQIIDYLEQTFLDEKTPKLMPDKESMYYPRVQHYRELLDSLPMDAYTHGCILHPELTVDSMIPAYATTRIRSQIGNTESELKKLAEENPDLQEAYIAKQKRLKSKLLDHDNVKYLKKILDELEKVLDQVETELQRRNEETPEEGRQPWLCGESFTLADVSLAVTLHRLKFLGFARRNWGNGKRPNLETYYERVLKRKTFNKVLGHVNNILISAVLPTALRVARKRAPKVLGTTLVIHFFHEAFQSKCMKRQKEKSAMSELDEEQELICSVHKTVTVWSDPRTVLLRVWMKYFGVKCRITQSCFRTNDPTTLPFSNFLML
ncbi:Ganglioside-induced differentiation-associated protein 1 [Myotis brandtii]|uniref:Ganglioside-induced differentiation-associated protein 1 n=1 Tax=Myotis brandtii TaxID=109478 RepID=S7MUB2_MYOBR|nr:Ganglioside-induced differentiation-associated protein 1 [Myotis brandtii]